MHLLIRAAAGVAFLPAGARSVMELPKNDLYFSVASRWEIAIKKGLHRPNFQLDARVLWRGLIDNGYHELPILSEHVVAIDMLPPVHKDPFDRLRIAQASAEGITLLTNEAIVAAYLGPVRLV